MDWTAVVLTLRLATATTAVLIVLGLPLAWWLTTTHWKGKFLVEALVTLPILLPPTVLGFYLLLLLGPHSPLGRAMIAMTGESLPFTFGGLLVASIIFNAPFAVRPFVAALAGVDRRLLEASWCLGHAPFRTFVRIALPLAWPGILTGAVLSFAHTIGEFGVVLMVGGNIPGATQTLSIILYDQVQALDYAAAHTTAAALMAFSFIALCLLYAVQRRGLWP